MGTFLEFSKSKTPASRWRSASATSGFRGLTPIALIRQEMQSRKEQCSRVSTYIVRVTVGNEITDYHLPFQPGEVLWAVDYNRLGPIAKFFGRFKQGRFTGLKYHYSYYFDNNQSHQYVESIAEYRDGRPLGAQVSFDVQGNVVTRHTLGAPVAQPVIDPTPEC